MTAQHQLTDRQTQVLRLIASGMPMKQIGDEIGISAKTAFYHWSQVKRRLRVDNYVTATRLAIKLGISSQ